MDWTREQTLIALEYYFRTPFGRLHSKNPEIIALAKQIGRSPGALALKLCNFASCDPKLASRGISGMSHCSKLDRELFHQFLDAPEQALEEITAINEPVKPASDASESVSDTFPVGEDVPSQTTFRRGQTFFRQALYSNYAGRCVISGMQVPALLTASHIIPWKVDPKRRCDPRNGLLLSALHDRAFDRGYISLSDELEVLVSPALELEPSCEFTKAGLLDFAGRRLSLPETLKFAPSEEALAYHRSEVFLSH